MLMAFLRKSDKSVIFICLSFRGEINLYKCRWNRRGNPRAKNPKSPLSQTNFANLKCAFVCPCTLWKFKACFCLSLLNFVILSLSLQNFVNLKCILFAIALFTNSKCILFAITNKAQKRFLIALRARHKPCTTNHKKPKFKFYTQIFNQ